MTDPARSARRSMASLDVPRRAKLASTCMLAALLGAGVACAGDPAPCLCPPATPYAAVPTAAPAAPPAPAKPPVAAPAPDLWAAPRSLAASSQSAGLALDTAENLFKGRLEAVRRLLQPELAEDLTVAKLSGIVDGLVKAHGAPAQVMDAWASEIKEKEVVSPAAEALIRMQSGKRIGLLLVFDPQGAVRGLWLRPI